jgi:hypothetical protein
MQPGVVKALVVGEVCEGWGGDDYLYSFTN